MRNVTTRNGYSSLIFQLAQMFDTMITMVSRTVGFKPTKHQSFHLCLFICACHGTWAVSKINPQPRMPPPAMVVTNRGIGGGALRFLSKMWWTLTLQLHPFMNHPSIQQPTHPKISCICNGPEGSHGFHQETRSGTRRGTAGRMRCPTRSGGNAGGHWGRWHGTGVFGGEGFLFSGGLGGKMDLIRSGWSPQKRIEPLKQKSWMSGISQI